MKSFTIHNSVRFRLGIIFLGFSLLVSASVIATYLAARAQNQDAAVINLAGRQRMLSQRITNLAIQGETPGGDNELTRSIQLFSTNLAALSEGGYAAGPDGESVYLPPPPDQEMSTLLAKIRVEWEAYQAALALPAASLDSTRLLNLLDTLVTRYQEGAQGKVQGLQRIQMAFLIAAFALLGAGYWTVHQSIIAPLRSLKQAAHTLSQGDIQPDKTQAFPITANTPEEIGELSLSLERMRQQLENHQEYLEAVVLQRTAQLKSAFEFSQEIVTELDISHLLESVTSRAGEILNAGTSSLCLLRGASANGGRLPAGVYQATTLDRNPNSPDPQPEYLKLVARDGARIDGETLLQSLDKGMVFDIIYSESGASKCYACSECVYLRDYTDSMCIAAPLQVGQQVLGALCVVRQADHPFDIQERQALALLANSAAVALENARLIQERQVQARQAATMAERERLAAELHDHLAQTLSFLRLRNEYAQQLAAEHTPNPPGGLDPLSAELAQNHTIIERAFEQVRVALVDLKEPRDPVGDLTLRVQAFASGFTNETGIPVTIQSPDDGVQLPSKIQNQLFLIIREALTNIRRHAGATQVTIALAHQDGHIVVHITDDGRGFDPGAMEDTNHLGLRIMRTRATRTGGSLAIQSAPQQGTTITIQVPAADQEQSTT